MRSIVPLSLPLLCLCALAIAAPAQTTAPDSPDEMWVDLSTIDLDAIPVKNAKLETFVHPTVFRPLWLDEALLDDVLRFAPMEDIGDPDRFAKSGVTIWLPMPDGVNIEFAIVESPIKEKMVGGTGLEPVTPCMSSNGNPVGNALQSRELQAGEFDGCTNGCTRTPEAAQSDRLEALADALRSLTGEERAALRALLDAPTR